MDERITLLVADDDDNTLDVLRAVIATDPSLDLVGVAKDAEVAIDLARQRRPEVALLDARMPGGGGVRAAREILRRSPITKVVALSAFDDRDTVLAMLRAGALSYVAKGDSTAAILRAIHSAVANESIVPGGVSSVAEALAEYHAHRLRRSAATRAAVERIERVLQERGPAVVFQPIVRLSDGAIVGVEALARFRSRPRRPPQAWFAEAASIGRLADLELAALGQAFERFEQLTEGIYLSVNVSPETAMSARFPAMLERLDLSRLVLEITEHAPVDDYPRLLAGLQPLRQAGLRIAVDDAGAGFSSLRHIVRLVPDYIKLDVSLTRDVDADHTRQALVSTMVSFANQIEGAIVAEGIEARAELDTLRAMGVRFGQGFLLGRPGPLPRLPAEAQPPWPGRHAFDGRSDRTRTPASATAVAT